MSDELFWVIELKDLARYRDVLGNWCGCIHHAQRFPNKETCEIEIKKILGYNNDGRWVAVEHMIVWE